MGRPREFDVDAAIGVACELFWRNGYEGTSLADLTAAIGITPPSFYSAFGSKDTLFARVADHYQATQQTYMEEALQRATARDVVVYMLYRKADAQTQGDHPPGCLLVNCSLPSAGSESPIREELARRPEHARDKLRDRLVRAQADGDLPWDADVDELARYVLVVGWGMAMEAQSGATREQLYGTVDRALRAWPD